MKSHVIMETTFLVMAMNCASVKLVKGIEWLYFHLPSCTYVLYVVCMLCKCTCYGR